MTRAFGLEGEDALHEDWWRWKYSDNPRGRHSIVCEGPEGIVGHYGGVPSRVCIDDAPYRFGQNCDSCTDPAVRRGLRKPGLFVRLGQAYASTYAIPGGDAVMYGLPIRSAFRVGARYLDYWMLRAQGALSADAASSLPVGASALEVETSDTIPPDVDDSFLQECRPRARCAREHDLSFFEWRFVRAPHASYEFVVARDSRRVVRGLAVQRVCELWGRRSLALMDIVHADGDREALSALLAWSAQQARGAGASSIVALAAPPNPHFAALQELGFRYRCTDWVLAARPYHPDLRPAFLREHWSYSFADFDVL